MLMRLRFEPATEMGCVMLGRGPRSAIDRPLAGEVDDAVPLRGRRLRSTPRARPNFTPILDSQQYEMHQRCPPRAFSHPECFAAVLSGVHSANSVRFIELNFI